MELLITPEQLGMEQKATKPSKAPLAELEHCNGFGPAPSSAGAAFSTSATQEVAGWGKSRVQPRAEATLCPQGTAGGAGRAARGSVLSLGTGLCALLTAGTAQAAGADGISGCLTHQECLC